MSAMVVTILSIAVSHFFGKETSSNQDGDQEEKGICGDLCPSMTSNKIKSNVESKEQSKEKTMEKNQNNEISGKEGEERKESKVKTAVLAHLDRVGLFVNVIVSLGISINLLMEYCID